jgi:hypothetical protein
VRCFDRIQQLSDLRPGQDRGRHPGFAGACAHAGGPGSLALTFGGRVIRGSPLVLVLSEAVLVLGRTGGDDGTGFRSRQTECLSALDRVRRGVVSPREGAVRTLSACARSMTTGGSVDPLEHRRGQWQAQPEGSLSFDRNCSWFGAGMRGDSRRLDRVRGNRRDGEPRREAAVETDCLDAEARIASQERQLSKWDAAWPRPFEPFAGHAGESLEDRVRHFGVAGGDGLLDLLPHALLPIRETIVGACRDREAFGIGVGRDPLLVDLPGSWPR